MYRTCLVCVFLSTSICVCVLWLLSRQKKNVAGFSFTGATFDFGGEKNRFAKLGSNLTSVDIEEI